MNLKELCGALKKADDEILLGVGTTTFNVWEFEPISNLLQNREEPEIAALILKSRFFDALRPADNAIIAQRVVDERFDILISTLRAMLDQGKQQFTSVESEVLYTTIGRWLTFTERATS